MAQNELNPLHTAEAARLQEENEHIIGSWRDYLDMSLGLTFELGRTRLTAAALLKLDVDSIVQLTGSTGEGVDIWSGERRLARGEVIMIEDRTGVRINEVLAYEEL